MFSSIPPKQSLDGAPQKGAGAEQRPQPLKPRADVARASRDTDQRRET